jgi:hypothetical protein
VTWVALALAIASPAAAQDVMVASFGGPRGEVVRRSVVRSLEEAPGVRVVESGPAEVVVEGRVARSGRQWQAAVEVRDAQGRELATETLRARQVTALALPVGRWARDRLLTVVASVASARPALQPEPPPAAPVRRSAVVQRAEPAAPVASPPRLPAPLSLRAGFALVGRSFTYSDDIFAALRSYSLPVAPMVTVGLEWRPGGHADLGVLSGLSVRADAEVALALETVGPNGTVFPTEMWSVGAGLRYALTVDEVTFHVDGGYRAQMFTIRDASELQVRPAIPGIEIHALRAGGGVRWDVGPVFFAGQMGYLAPLAAGEIASAAWFPRAQIGGIEGDIGVGVRVDDVEIRGMFAARRFFYDMRSEPGDARVAGGAVDQYMSGQLELTWTPSQLR